MGLLALHLGHTALLGPIFYVSKITGLLPLSYNYELLSKCKYVCSNSQGKPFTLSFTGLFLSFIQLINLLWTSYNIFLFCLNTAIEYNVTCMRGNLCVIYGIFMIHVTVGLFNVLSAIINCKNSAKCLNSAYHLLDHKHPSYSRLPLATFSIFGFILLLVIRLILNTFSHIEFPLFYYGYYISYFAPIVMLNLVATLALAAENAYKQVNHNLEELFSEQSKSKHFLFRLRKQAITHNNITDFVDEISACFGLDIFLGMFDCFTQFVLFLYLTIWTLLVEGLFSNWVIPYLTTTVEIATIVFKIVYLCYRSQKASQQGSLILWYLHRLSTRTDLDHNCHQQISTFVMQHNSRKIEITALKLFSLNMNLLFKILGIVSTYFIVLIQFQISGGKPTFTPNKVNVTKGCKKWPCIGS